MQMLLAGKVVAAQREVTLLVEGLVRLRRCAAQATRQCNSAEWLRAAATTRRVRLLTLRWRNICSTSRLHRAVLIGLLSQRLRRTLQRWSAGAKARARRSTLLLRRQRRRDLGLLRRVCVSWELLAEKMRGWEVRVKKGRRRVAAAAVREALAAWELWHKAKRRGKESARTARHSVAFACLSLWRELTVAADMGGDGSESRGDEAEAEQGRLRLGTRTRLPLPPLRTAFV